MGKRKRERASTPSNSKSWQTDFVEYANPLADLPEAKRLAIAAAVAKNAEERFQQSAAEIADILAACDPPLILANMAIHFFGIQSAGEREVPAELIIQQHHIELLQALALRAPMPGRRERRVATSVSDLMPLVRENATTFQQRVKVQPGEAKDNKLKVAQHQIRGDTQTVRGEFHAEQTERYLRAIFARIDGPFRAAYGVSGSHVVDTLMGLLRRVELKINAWRKSAIRVFRERKDQKALKAFVAGFSQYSEAEVKALLAAAHVPAGYVSRFLLEQANLHLDTVYSFTLEDVRAVLPVGADESAMLAVLRSWSLAYGDLADLPIERIHLANPVWTRPFIDVGDDMFHWPSPGTMIAFTMQMFEDLIDAIPKLKTAYEAARGKVLEDELSRLVRVPFRDGRIFTKLKWRDDLDGREYETDAFVLIDRTALIFEAKAGRITPQARRGADERLKREIAKLMEDPAIQSSRLEALLRRHPEVHHFTAAEGEAEIDGDAIDQFIRFNITFNILGPLTASWPSLVEAGLIRSETPFTPTMSAGDLDMVFELLETPAEIVHYLRRRTEFEGNAQFLADEYDLIAFYIASGFNIGATEYDKTYLGIYGMSRDLDAYFVRLPPGEQRPPKPKQARTGLWRRLLADLAERQSPNWLELSHRLLNVDHEVQTTLEHELPRMRAKVLKSKKDTDAQWGLLLNPTIERRNPVAFVVYKAPTRAARDYVMRSAGASLIEEAGTPDCLVIAFDARRWSGSYTEIGMVLAPAP